MIHITSHQIACSNAASLVADRQAPVEQASLMHDTCIIQARVVLLSTGRGIQSSSQRPSEWQEITARRLLQQAIAVPLESGPSKE
jgi:hypothetical protein